MESNTINEMKKTIRRTEIQIETHEFTVIRRRDGQSPVYCARCQTMVTGFKPEERDPLFPLPEVWRLAARDELHLVHGDRGEALVCGASLENKTNLRRRK